VRPLPFSWPYAAPYWALFVWAFAPEFGIIRRARRAQTDSDSKSLQVIVLGQSIANAAAFWMAFIPSLQSPHRAAMFYGGLAVLVTGSVLRRHCWRMLGTSFTGDVRASADQAIVQRGAYRLLRHPSYTAGILLNAGVGIALGSWASAALMVLGSFVVYQYRMIVEERTLATVGGEPYREFMRTRKRLIPFVY